LAKEETKKKPGRELLNEMFNVGKFTAEDLTARYDKYLNKILQKHWDPYIT
jgi:hypothetical protein